MEPCLYELAASNQLPDHQCMDRQTLDWICAHEPPCVNEGFSQSSESLVNTSSLKDALYQFSPHLEWYAHPALAQSLHGLRHCLRVIVLARSLSSTIVQYQTEILIAASLHDLRRNNDRQDPGHGLRAAEWWMQNVSMVLEEYQLHKVNESLVFDAIRFHDVPSDNICADDPTSPPAIRRAIETLKLADALDRYRLPKVKWWINDTHVNMPASSQLKRFSFRLMLNSERSFLDGISSVESVRSAIDSASKP